METVKTHWKGIQGTPGILGKDHFMVEKDKMQTPLGQICVFKSHGHVWPVQWWKMREWSLKSIQNHLYWTSLSRNQSPRGSLIFFCSLFSFVLGWTKPLKSGIDEWSIYDSTVTKDKTWPQIMSPKLSVLQIDTVDSEVFLFILSRSKEDIVCKQIKHKIW